MTAAEGSLIHGRINKSSKTCKHPNNLEAPCASFLSSEISTEILEASEGQTGLGTTQGNLSASRGSTAASRSSAGCSSQPQEQLGGTGMGTGQCSWPSDTTGLGHQAHSTLLLCSSCLLFTALQRHGLAGPLGPWLALKAKKSFFTYRNEMEKTWSNSLRSLLWKRRAAPAAGGVGSYSRTLQ